MSDEWSEPESESRVKPWLRRFAEIWFGGYELDAQLHGGPMQRHHQPGSYHHRLEGVVLSTVVFVAVPLLLYLLCYAVREVWYDTKRPDTREAQLNAPRGEHESSVMSRANATSMSRAEGLRRR
jgi:hypothetical protein